MKRIFSFIFLVFCFTFYSNLNILSQKTPAKFGKIDIENLKAEYCPIDSNAHAYYIFDYGRSFFEYFS